MTTPNNTIREKVKQWIEYGDDDLNYARHGLSIDGNIPYQLIAYHSQQCAEKYIKAYLVFHGIDFPYTHNISHLLDLLPKGTLVEKLYVGEELSPFAIATRYPSNYEPVTESEALRAIELAESVKQVIRSMLTNDGFTL